MISKDIIIFPGLNDSPDHYKYRFVTAAWARDGRCLHIFDADWNNRDEDYGHKLQRAKQFVNRVFTKSKRLVPIIGNSAGSSLAVILLLTCPDKVGKIIVNCGRVRTGDYPWYTFDQATASSLAFRNYVLQAEKAETTMSDKTRQKILPLIPIFDEIVPGFTVPIVGAINETIPSIEHVFSIAINLTILRHRIYRFIDN